MAVNLSITQPSGIITTYNRITDIRYQPKGSLDVMLSSYVDQASREAGKESVNDQYVPLDITQVDATQEIQAQCYAQLKAGILSGGTDC